LHQGDAVSRAIVSEMVKTGSEHVYLDLRHLNSDFVKKRFPRIYTTCLSYGIDITKDLIPVSPAAHYIMGGVKTDLSGATNIKGLFACGEVACTGVHGANRLASNSLLEGLVYGARTGMAAGLYGENASVKKDISIRDLEFSSIPTVTSPPKETILDIKRSLKRLMWQKVGIIRCGKSLEEAKEVIKKWRFLTEALYLTREEAELKNMLMVSEAIVLSAMERKGSVGAHYRTDYKERGSLWQRHVEVVMINQEMKTKLEL
jgi:L-aspartate oxidase